MSEAKEIDATVLLEAACGDPEIARTLVDLFFSETGKGIEMLNAAVESGDVAESARVAHKMVGSVVAAGMQEFAQDLRDLELKCEGDFPEDIQERMARMNKDMADARRYFERVLSEI